MIIRIFSAFGISYGLANFQSRSKFSLKALEICQTLALYSARNREMLEYHLPKIAEAYRKLGREEKAREVLLELEN